MKTSDEHLQEGIAAYKQGRKQAAGRSFIQAIKINPKNENAWLWLSGTVESDEQRRTCLERVLAINPGNRAAQNGLRKLSAETPPQSPPLASPERVQETPTPPQPLPIEATETTAEPTPKASIPFPQRKKRKGQRRVFLGIGFFVALAAFLVYTYRPFPMPAITSLVQRASQEYSSTEESAVLAAVYENIAAANAENVERYMASLHTQSRAFELTREKLEAHYQAYDLTATISGVKIIYYSPEEAQVSYTLETRKRSGPDFRDNRINGIFVLRPEDGQWKLYGQLINKIQYFEYRE